MYEKIYICDMENNRMFRVLLNVILFNKHNLISLQNVPVMSSIYMKNWNEKEKKKEKKEL